jgi:hypothetical protein
MSYYWDRFEPNPLHEIERQEARDALRYSTGTCPPGHHHMASDGRGGGVCACGFTVDAEEVS